MKNWRTNLGCAISMTGTALIGIGVLPELSQLSPSTAILSSHQLAILWYTAFAGFVISAIGKGVTALFAADARQVQNIQDQMNQVPTAIDSGNTDVLRKSQPPTTTPTDPTK